MGAQPESTKGQACPDIFQVCVGNKSHFAKLAFALAALLLKNVPLSLLPPQNLAGASRFETLGDGFPCFCFSCGAGHGARRLTGEERISRDFSQDFGQGPHILQMAVFFNRKWTQRDADSMGNAPDSWVRD